jgi:hypothetical protein
MTCVLSSSLHRVETNVLSGSAATSTTTSTTTRSSESVWATHTATHTPDPTALQWHTNRTQLQPQPAVDYNAGDLHFVDGTRFGWVPLTRLDDKYLFEVTHHTTQHKENIFVASFFFFFFLSFFFSLFFFFFFFFFFFLSFFLSLSKPLSCLMCVACGVWRVTCGVCRWV